MYNELNAGQQCNEKCMSVKIATCKQQKPTLGLSSRCRLYRQARGGQEVTRMVWWTGGRGAEVPPSLAAARCRPVPPHARSPSFRRFSLPFQGRWVDGAHLSDHLGRRRSQCASWIFTAVAEKVTCRPGSQQPESQTSSVAAWAFILNQKFLRFHEKAV